MRATKTAVIVATALLLIGCPPPDAEKTTDAGSPAACAKVGTTCKVSPGKLGTCVAKDDCPTPGACFTCQSQH